MCTCKRFIKGHNIWHTGSFNLLASIYSSYLWTTFKNVAQKSLKNKTTTKTQFLSNTKSLAYADREDVLGKKLSLENVVFLSPKFPDYLKLDINTALCPELK